ncbi:MAG TPA: amidohydrolase family protein [Polyangia bacterium]|nr:amidohydrolase family protein [Polyangia bacterium]
MQRFSADWMVPVIGPPLRDATITLDGAGRVLALEPGRHPEAEPIAGVVMPALTNAHVHLELSALRGRAPGGRGFLGWVVSMLAERQALGREALRAAIPDAVAEAVRYGTAAVGDITNTLDAVPALAAAGLRGVVFHELLERDDLEHGDAVAWARAQRAAISDWPDGLAYAVAPHAPYSTSADLIRRAMAASPGVPTSIHVAEDPDELALLRDGSGPWPRILTAFGVWERAEWVAGRGPVEHLDALGFLARRPPPLLIHMVHASADELALVAAREATIVLCPRSNLHIGQELADVPAMVGAGCRLALGTDSLSSNQTLSIFSEMAALARAFPALSRADIVRWATLGGASALGLGEELGALAAGRQPGVIAVCGHAGADPYQFLTEAEPEEVRWLSRA